MYETKDGWVGDSGDKIPMPEQSHPDMGDVHVPDGFRKQIIVRLEWSPNKSYNDFDKVVETTTFERFTYQGPMPFVGDSTLERYFYRWDAWVAADGRWIGGHPAQIIYRRHWGYE